MYIRPKGDHYEYDVMNNSDDDIWTAIYGRNPWYNETYLVEGKASKSLILSQDYTFEKYFKHYTYYTIGFFKGNGSTSADEDRYQWPKYPKNIVMYYLTLDDLIFLDWTIPYPPDERMQSMDMYPSYDNLMSHSTFSE